MFEESIEEDVDEIGITCLCRGCSNLAALVVFGIVFGVAEVDRISLLRDLTKLSGCRLNGASVSLGFRAVIGVVMLSPLVDIFLNGVG